MRRFGKSGAKAAVVFAPSPETCHRAVSYLRTEIPDIPVFLFSTSDPSPDTAALCAHVCVRSSALVLIVAAQRTLWHSWVAITVGVWNRSPRKWLLKGAPFFIPPFRVLLLNANGDFLPGTPLHVGNHAAHIVRDRASSVRHAIREAAHSAADLFGSAHRKLSHLLLIAASAACGNVLRRAFCHLNGETALWVTPEPAVSDGIAIFHQTADHWDGAELERFARASTDTAPPDLTAPFSDPTAFAVSRQEHFRAWKPVLLPTAPFRALQKGEAAQVLAPISSTILVDRQKLLALGIPRCHLAETAWMLCFWKAAAAGWRSFSAGQDAPLSEQPDFPVPETEFLLRVLFDGRLRRLAPAEPVLSRGTVAFAPAEKSDSSSDRLRVLLVTPFLPFPLSHGGAVRIFNLCHSLADRVDFHLVALREKDEAVDYGRLSSVFRHVSIVDIDERSSANTALPEQVRRTQSEALRTLIADIARQWEPDVLQIEYTHMAAFRDAAPDLPALLVEHDLTFSLYGQLAARNPGDAAQREYRRWLEFERHWLARYDGVWTVSADDCDRAIDESGRSPASTFVVPNGVDVERFRPSPRPIAPEILYIGSFRHLPNVIGFEHLRRDVMPRVWRLFPEARLRVIAGKDFERYWTGDCDSRIHLHGFVEDVRPFYASAALVAVPLAVSAGTNIKVLEAMASGRAVISTPVGCAGLGLCDGHDIVIRQDWGDFAGAVCHLLATPEEAVRVAANARRTVEARFSWHAIAGAAYQSYLALSAHTHGRRFRLPTSSAPLVSDLQLSE